MDCSRCMNEFDGTGGNGKPSKKGRRKSFGCMRVSHSRLFLTKKLSNKNKGRKGNGKPPSKKGRRSASAAATGCECIGQDCSYCYSRDLCFEADKEPMSYPMYWELFFHSGVSEANKKALNQLLAEALSDDYDYPGMTRARILTPNSDDGLVNDVLPEEREEEGFN